MNTHLPAHLMRCKAFTITELLTVVGIITLLAALVTPTVSKAIAKADEAHCMNNLRQMGAALIMYSNDNNSKYPPTSNYYDSHASVLAALKPYTGDNVNVWFCKRYLKDAPGRNAKVIYDGGEFGYYYWAFNTFDTSQPLTSQSATSAWSDQGYKKPLTGQVLFSDIFGDKTYWGGADDVQMHAGSSRYLSLKNVGTLVFTSLGSVEKLAPKGVEN